MAAEAAAEYVEGMAEKLADVLSQEAVWEHETTLFVEVCL